MAKIRALTDSGADRVRRAVLAVEAGLHQFPPGAGDQQRQWQIKLGKADTDISAGSSGYFEWWRTTEVETGETSQSTGVWAHDWFETGFDEGDKVLLFRPLPSARKYAIKLSGTDELVRVTSDDTAADYLADKHYNLVTGSTFDTDWDIPVAVEVYAPTGYEQVFHFINTSAINDWSTKNSPQLLAHGSTHTGWAALENGSAAYDPSQDLDVSHWIFPSTVAGGPLGSLQFRGFINASNIYGYSTAGEWHLGVNDGTWSFLAPGSSATGDELVKVTSDDTAADYLWDQMTYQTGSTYSAGWDMQVASEVNNAGGDESLLNFVNISEITNIATAAVQMLIHTSTGTAWTGLRHNSTVGDTTIDLYIRHDIRDIGGGNIRFEGFIDADLITGYSSAGEYHLGITDGQWAWHTPPGAGGGGDDELVRVTSDDTAADYLWDQMTNRTASTYSSVYDLRVDSEVVNAGADESLRHFVNASTLYNYSSVSAQLLGHSSTQVGWIGLRHNSTVGDTTIDLYIKHDVKDLGGGNLRFEGFIDASEIYSYSSNGEWHLGISDGQWQWLAPGSGGGGDDIYVKVSGNDSAAGYLETKFTGVSTSGGADVYDTTQDLVVKHDVTNDSGLEKLQSFVDMSVVPNYSGTVDAFLVNDSTGKTRFTRNNLTGSLASEDLEITHQIFEEVGVSKFRSFIDASTIYGFTTLSEVHLALNNGTWQFIAPPPGGGTDEKVKVSANDTNANYLEVKLVNVSTSGGVFASGHDLTIDLDVENDGGAEQIRPFIDASAIPSYSSNTELHLGISGSTWQWLTPSAGDDELVKVSADDTTADYLEGKLHNQSGTILFTSQQDYEVKWDTINPSSDEQQRGYIDASTFANWNTAEFRVLGHITGGNKYLYGLENDNGTTYSSSGDLKFVNTVRLTSGIYRRRTFLDADQLTGHSSDGQLYLGIDDGTWKFLSPGADDVYVKVSGDDTGSTYLEDQLDNHTGATPTFSSSKDFKAKFDTINPGADEKIRGYLQSTDISGFSSNAEVQLLGIDHTTQGPRWFTFLDLASDGTYSATYDLPIHVEDDGSVQDLRAFIDASSIVDYEATAEQSLIHQSSGGFAWAVGNYPIWFASDNELTVTASGIDHGFDMTPGISPSSSVHGMTLTSSGEIYFHRAGVYYIEWETLLGLDGASTEMAFVQSRPQVWNGAAWNDRQIWMSVWNQQLMGTTEAVVGNGVPPGQRMHGTLMTTITTGNKLRMHSAGGLAGTTNNLSVGIITLGGVSVFVRRVSSL